MSEDPKSKKELADHISSPEFINLVNANSLLLMGESIRLAKFDSLAAVAAIIMAAARASQMAGVPMQDCVHLLISQYQTMADYEAKNPEPSDLKN